MKVTILIFLLFGISWGWAATCLPYSQENKLHHVRDITSMELFTEKFQDLIFKILPSDINLIMQFQSLNPRVNAELTKLEQTLTITVMGGMLAHEMMNENALALLLCHELGHFLGGPPLKSRGGWSSTEGQADYFSGLSCARVIELGEEDFIDGAIRLTSIYAEVMREPEPKITQCEEVKAPRTIFGYPSVQCRLDTIMAGWENRLRPQCWFIE